MTVLEHPLRSTVRGTAVHPPRLRPSQRHPWLLPWAVRAHRARRRLVWLASGTSWARMRSPHALPEVWMEHASLLVRDLSPRETELQRGKVVNLRLAAARVDGLVVRPGETFSFNHVVGSCTRRKGYVEGMRLVDGVPTAGVGGGVCQLANLLHWMVLHSPLTVVERSEHSYDPFPDKDRVLPFGVGCSIVWNYVDLVVRNDTDTTFQLRARVGPQQLHGELRADAAAEHDVRVEARGERFVHSGGQVRRTNQIWRTSTSRSTGEERDELLFTNDALVRYAPAAALVVDLDDAPHLG